MGIRRWISGTLRPDKLETDSVNTENLLYRQAPPGAAVKLDGNQDIASGTLTNVHWEVGERDPDGLLDAGQNAVVIPSGYSFAKVTTALNFRNQISGAFDVFDIQLNGADIPTFGGRIRSEATQQSALIATAWFAIDQGDEITTRVRQESGSSESLADDRNTFMEVWLV